MRLLVLTDNPANRRLHGTSPCGSSATLPATVRCAPHVTKNRQDEATW